MKENYYQFEFDNEVTDDETISYFDSLSESQLINLLNYEFDDIDFDLRYYATIIDSILDRTDYNEHYYRLMCLTEELNNIKIMLTILKEKYHN